MRSWFAGALSAPSIVAVAEASTQPASWAGPEYVKAFAVLVSAFTGLLIAYTGYVNARKAANDKRTTHNLGAAMLLSILTVAAAASHLSCSATPATRVAAARELYTGALRTAVELRKSGQLSDAGYVRVEAARRVAAEALDWAERRTLAAGVLTPGDVAQVEAGVAGFLEAVRGEPRGTTTRPGGP